MAFTRPTDGQEIYDYFRSKPGSKHIATPVNIRKIIDLSKLSNPRNVLEFGGGIGTITYALLRHSKAHIEVYENNQFCIEQLNSNLSEFEGRFEIIDSYSKNPKLSEYDFVIIDGGAPAEISRIFSVVQFTRHVYVEGGRFEAREALLKATRSKWAVRVEKIAGDTKLKLKGGTLFHFSLPENPAQLESSHRLAMKDLNREHRNHRLKKRIRNTVGKVKAPLGKVKRSLQSLLRASRS